MKTIKIAYLYYDLMNLYGENGNIRYLVKMLEDQLVDIKVDYLTIGDKITSDYDIYYMGTGSEENASIVLEDIKKYKKELEIAINNNKYFIITGNSLDFFGTTININNKFTDALDILPYIVKIDTNKERIVGEQYYKCDLINHSVIGFENRYSTISSIGEGIDTLFDVIDGVSYDGDYDIKKEGIKYNNFYGTYLIGPFLVRNPYFTDYLIEDICKSNDVKYRKGKRNGYSYLAYNEYLKNFYEKINS